MQRAGLFSALPGLLREMGCDPDALLAAAGFAVDGFGPETLAPMGNFLRLMEGAAAAANCPDLGLRIGLRYELHHHGLIGALMQTAPTLHRALLDLVTWQPGYSSGAIVYLRPEGEGALLGYGTYDRGPVSSSHLLHLAMGNGIRMIELLTAGKATPGDLNLACRPMDGVARPALPLRYNQQQTCIVLDREALRTPVVTADPERRLRLLLQMEAMPGLRLGTTAARVRHRLRPLIQSHQPGMAAVAAEMGLHPRTLRRRLAAEGERFEDILDDVRLSLAQELLELTDIPTSDIADALAYAAPGILSDAFRRWSGCSPSAWRAASRFPQ